MLLGKILILADILVVPIEIFSAGPQTKFSVDLLVEFSSPLLQFAALG